MHTHTHTHTHTLSYHHLHTNRPKLLHNSAQHIIYLAPQSIFLPAPTSQLSKEMGLVSKCLLLTHSAALQNITAKFTIQTVMLHSLHDLPSLILSISPFYGGFPALRFNGICGGGECLSACINISFGVRSPNDFWKDVFGKMLVCVSRYSACVFFHPSEHSSSPHPFTNGCYRSQVRRSRDKDEGHGCSPGRGLIPRVFACLGNGPHVWCVGAYPRGHSTHRRPLESLSGCCSNQGWGRRTGE